MNRLLILRLAVSIALVFCAMTAAWSFGGYVRARSGANLLAGTIATVFTLGLAWWLKRLARYSRR